MTSREHETAASPIRAAARNIRFIGLTIILCKIGIKPAPGQVNVRALYELPPMLYETMRDSPPHYEVDIIHPFGHSPRCVSDAIGSFVGEGRITPYKIYGVAYAHVDKRL